MPFAKRDNWGVSVEVLRQDNWLPAAAKVSFTENRCEQVIGLRKFHQVTFRPFETIDNREVSYSSITQRKYNPHKLPQTRELRSKGEKCTMQTNHPNPRMTTSRIILTSSGPNRRNASLAKQGSDIARALAGIAMARKWAWDSSARSPFESQPPTLMNSILQGDHYTERQQIIRPEALIGRYHFWFLL